MQNTPEIESEFFEPASVKMIITAWKDSAELIESTHESLLEHGWDSDDIMVIALVGPCESTRAWCAERGLQLQKFASEFDAYITLSETLGCDYLSFPRAGDTFRQASKEMVLRYLTRTGQVFVGQTVYDGRNTPLSRELGEALEFPIDEYPNKVARNLSSAFLGTQLATKLEDAAPSQLNYYARESLLSKAVIANRGFKSMRRYRCNSILSPDDTSAVRDAHYDLAWYEEAFAYIQEIRTFADQQGIGRSHAYVQRLTGNTLKTLLLSNANSKNKHIVVGERWKKLQGELEKAISNLEDEAIWDLYGNPSVNLYLIRLKHGQLGNGWDYLIDDEGIAVSIAGRVYQSASEINVKVLLMAYENGMLNLTCTYPFPFDESKLSIYATYKGVRHEARRSGLYQDYTAFGQLLYRNHAFDLAIPLKESAVKEAITFHLQADGVSVPLNIAFPKPLAHISNTENAYYDCGKFSILYDNDALMVYKNSPLRHARREMRFLRTLHELGKRRGSAAEAFKVRFLYDLTKPFYRKEIWLFEDKIYKAGDNGEYLYRYTVSQNDGISKYYIMQPDCLDAERFKEEGLKFVPYGSLRHKLLYLNSNVVFTTHNNAVKHHSFGDTEIYFRDLLNATNMCIQHGLTVQRIPHLTNRINDNLKRYFLASPIEEENVLSKEYAYSGHENCLVVTGSPRYDGLVNRDNRQILISPSWRSYIASPVVFGSARPYNEKFKESTYFQIYNRLINDERLIATAQNCGYKIVYLLHPCTSAQLEDFDTNPSVELKQSTADTSYEQMLTESSLLLTDYSGIQFDFAYMYKPIVYLHPDELPPSYEEGAYRYDTMALGEIVKTVDQAVDLICSYMANDCRITDEYRKRIDSFFAYHDRNNCQRIYDEVIRYRKAEQQVNGGSSK